MEKMQEVCASDGCINSAKLRCPKCIQLGITVSSYFCSQECFKGNWNFHKSIHKTFHRGPDFITNSEQSEDASYNPWPTYQFTGKLRPYPLSVPNRMVPYNIDRPDYAEHSRGIPTNEEENKGSNDTTIKVLDDEEKEAMRVSCKLAREVLNEASEVIGVNVTTDEIDRIVHEACVDRECYPSPLNYYLFPRSCCTSVNEVICHGIPDLRPLQDGDICNVDVTIYHNGFHGDLNETFLIGKVDDSTKKLVQNTWECLQKAIEAVRPGTKYRDIGNIIQQHASTAGLSVVRSYCGHGIHRLFHTSPNIPHYAKNRAIGIMKEGHCFTIEPMICKGNWRDTTWPDSWTAVTVDGSLSAQFEETLLVTENGCEILTRCRENGGKPYFMTSNK